MDRNDTGSPVELARRVFLRDDNLYGCAETSYIVLKSVFGLERADDSSPAMALNGGVAYSGSMCGALLGAGLALGELAAARVDDQQVAKREARRQLQEIMADFRSRFGATTCRELIKLDLSTPEGHDAFIQSGVWRKTCMAQIEFVVERLAALAEDNADTI